MRFTFYPPPMLVWILGFAAGAGLAVHGWPFLACLGGCMALFAFHALFAALAARGFRKRRDGRPPGRAESVAVPVKAQGSHWHVALAALAVMMAFGWGRLFLNPPWQRYLSQVPREQCSLTARLRISRAAIVPPPGHSPPGRPRLVGQLLAIRPLGGDESVASSGQVLLQAGPDLFPALAALAAGTELEATGVLILPPRAGEPYGYYGGYLQAQGIHRIFRLEQFTVTGCSRTPRWRLRRLLDRLRARLAAALAAGMPDSTATNMYLVLGTGLGEYLPSDLRQSFIHSGIVHIFAISGLHVGIVMHLGLLLGKLLGLGLRPRCVLCAAATALYVLLTGFSPSSVRALAMALLALYAGLRFRPANGLHAVSVAGSAALVVNPLLVMHTGFLFSYAVVLILVGGAPLLLASQALLTEKDGWIPPAFRHPGRFGRLAHLFRLERLPVAALLALASSWLAWLGSAGLAGRSSGTLCLLGPLLNLPVGLLLPGILLSFPAKILAAWFWPAANDWLVRILQFGLSLLQFLSDSAAESRWSVPVRLLDGPLLMAYYASLAAFIVPLLWLLAARDTGSPDRRDRQPDRLP